jgi:PAS domain S-box-containing protein
MNKKNMNQTEVQENLNNSLNYKKKEGGNIENENSKDRFSSSDYTFPISNKIKNNFAWRINKDFKFDFVSNKVKNILGYEPGELYDTKFFDLMSENECNIIKSGLSNNKSNYFYKFKSIFIKKDGSEIILHSNIITIFDENNMLYGYEGVSYISES